jgi:hypothetical protein
MSTAACNAPTPSSATKRRNGSKSCSMWSYCLQQSTHLVCEASANAGDAKRHIMLPAHWQGRIENYGLSLTGARSAFVAQSAAIHGSGEAAAWGIYSAPQLLLCDTRWQCSQSKWPFAGFHMCMLFCHASKYAYNDLPTPLSTVASPGVVIGRKPAPVLQAVTTTFTACISAFSCLLIQHDMLASRG